MLISHFSSEAYFVGEVPIRLAAMTSYYYSLAFIAITIAPKSLPKINIFFIVVVLIQS